MADEYNDGYIANGTALLTIDGTVFVAESVEITEPTGAMLEQKNENGIPSGWVGKRGFTDGTATLQVPAASTYSPVLYAEFTMDYRDETGVTWVITEVGESSGNEEITKFNISFRRRINTP